MNTISPTPWLRWLMVKTEDEEEEVIMGILRSMAF